MPENTEPDTTLVRWAYAGQRVKNPVSGALDHLWYVLEMAGDGTLQVTDKTYRFDTNLTRKVIGRLPAIGSTWDFHIEQRPPGISAYTSGKLEPQPQDRLHGAQVAEWEAKHRAALAVKETRATIRKHMAGSELSELLAPISKAYSRATGAERAALLAAVIAEITGAGIALPKAAKAKAKSRK